MKNQFFLVLEYISYYFERITDDEKQEGVGNDYTKFSHIFINDKKHEKKERQKENKDEVRGGEEEGCFGINR